MATSTASSASTPSGTLSPDSSNSRKEPRRSKRLARPRKGERFRERYLRWFRWLTGWCRGHLGFIIPSIFVPDLLEATLGPGSTAISYVCWPAGVVLAMATCSTTGRGAPGALPPVRLALVAGRALAAIFWLWQNARWTSRARSRILDAGRHVRRDLPGLLWLGYRKGGPRNPPSSILPPPPESALNGFRWVLWLSIALNLVFALWPWPPPPPWRTGSAPRRWPTPISGSATPDCC